VVPRMPTVRITLGFLVALAVCGCSRGVPMGQVDGVVRLNGAPMPDAMVTFIPEDRKLPQSTGFTDSEGHFHLRCSNGASGAAVGQHRVLVLDAAQAPSGKGKDDDELPEGKDAPGSRVPPRYARPDKTPLRQSVEQGSQEVAIDIGTPRRPS
jgi:hypothetical protein